MIKLPTLWLASASPRRAQLLSNLGLSFQTLASQVEEISPDKSSVETAVLENAERKASAILSQVAPFDIVIAADTLVVFEDRVLPKPATSEEVIANLKQLSGQTHRVLTGLVLLSSKLGKRSRLCESQVDFRILSDEEIRAYANTREPYDKAGGYGIQGLGCLFVKDVRGSYTNIMGLPVETLLTELAALTQISPYQWGT